MADIKGMIDKDVDSILKDVELTKTIIKDPGLIKAVLDAKGVDNLLINVDGEKIHLIHNVVSKAADFDKMKPAPANEAFRLAPKKENISIIGQKIEDNEDYK